MASEQIFLSNTNRSTELALRTANLDDQDNLRNWKNKNRQYFSNQALIPPEQQTDWFHGYSMRQHDYMFMVALHGKAIGCMGVRILEEKWDIYNVILGEPAAGGKGYMSRALQLMLVFAYRTRPCAAQLKVLKSNPAVGWYEKNRFAVVSDAGDHYLMRHDRAADSELAILALARP